MPQSDDYFDDMFEVLTENHGECVTYFPLRGEAVPLDAIVDRSATSEWFIAGEAVEFTAVIRVHNYADQGINPDNFKTQDQFSIVEHGGGSKTRRVSFIKLLNSDGAVLEIAVR